MYYFLGPIFGVFCWIVFLFRRDVQKQKQRIEQKKILLQELEKKFPKLFDVNNWELKDDDLSCKLTGELFNWRQRHIPKQLVAATNVSEQNTIEQFLFCLKSDLRKIKKQEDAIKAFQTFGADNNDV